MNEVSSRAFPPLLDALRRRHLPVAPLLEGLGFSEADLGDSGFRMGWNEYAIFLERFEQALGHETVAMIGRDFAVRDEYRAAGRLISLAISPYAAMKIVNRWFGPMLFNNIESVTSRLGDGTIEVKLRIPERYRDSPQFFRICASAMSSISNVLGDVNAGVEYELSPRSCVYRIRFPHRGAIKRLRQTFRVLFFGSELVEQFIQQQDELRTALTALRNTETSYRHLVDHLGDAVWRFDPHTMKVTFASAGYRRLLGMDPEEVVGKSLAELIRPDDIAWATETMQKIVNGERLEPFEVRLRNKRGEFVWAEVNADVERDADGRPIEILGVARDISTRKEAEADRVRAEAAEAARRGLEDEVEERRRIEVELRAAKEDAERSSRINERLLGTLSHEIRSPLTALIGFTEILKRELEGSPQARYADIVDRSGRKLLGTLNDVLDIVKFDAATAKPAIVAYPVAESLRRVADLYTAKANEKGVALELATDAECVVCSNRDADERVIGNIVANAIRFTDQGEVRIASEGAAFPDGSPGCAVTVTDTGRGMSPEFIPHAFEEFTQDPSGDARGGTGLGLAIAKRLIDAVGGSIRLESAEGRGTKVTVLLHLSPVNRENP